MNEPFAPASYNQDEQFQKAKSDIKNILPFDLYAGMDYTAKLRTALLDQVIPQDRLIKQFYEHFWMIFKLTELKITDTIATNIRDWFRIVHLPVQDKKMLQHGIELYTDFYNELVRHGMVTMFEIPVDPPMSGDMEDKLLEGIEEKIPDV